MEGFTGAISKAVQDSTALLDREFSAARGWPRLWYARRFPGLFSKLIEQSQALDTTNEPGGAAGILSRDVLTFNEY